MIKTMLPIVLHLAYVFVNGLNATIYIESIDFFSIYQSGFRPGDGTVYQLTLIVHQIYEALEKGKEVRMVFLDLSKAFDRVWHEGLLFKLCNIGVKSFVASFSGFVAIFLIGISESL